MDHDMRRAAYQMMLIGACALAPAVLGAGPVQAVDTALQLCGGGCDVGFPARANAEPAHGAFAGTGADDERRQTTAPPAGVGDGSAPEQVARRTVAATMGRLR